MRLIICCVFMKLMRLICGVYVCVHYFAHFLIVRCCRAGMSVQKCVRWTAEVVVTRKHKRKYTNSYKRPLNTPEMAQILYVFPIRVTTTATKSWLFVWKLRKACRSPRCQGCTLRLLSTGCMCGGSCVWHARAWFFLRSNKTRHRFPCPKDHDLIMFVCARPCFLYYSVWLQQYRLFALQVLN